MEAASRLTSAIKPEIAKMLMELSAGAANFTDQKEFSLQDIEVEYHLCHNWVGKCVPGVSENAVPLSRATVTMVSIFLWVLSPYKKLCMPASELLSFEIKQVQRLLNKQINLYFMLSFQIVT